ncbi:ABC transporter permease [Amycolatopsis sp. H20-H5]|uniref:ABC transporter permease n=1 Tax=Amycolatopsis sp. H20-H5 TaxID=3046309 RepID=UPI002DBBE2EB|nr:ABC transporter permease subunit [Amycolatopsis sp. H20-H5]MEC3976313.1 ABC transporter permease subunit [Amycolatopsis sp. H20-H5]
MLWLTWRQHRVQLLLTAGLLLALATGLYLNALGALDAANGQFSTLCRLGAIGCRQVDEGLQAWYDASYPYLASLPVLSVLLGVFWGAPLLSREFERGTYRLAWTQSVSRSSWLLGKLGPLALAAAVSGLAFGLMIDAWLRVFPGISGTFKETQFFSVVGVASVAWWLFAFVLGAAVGVMLKKVIPAIAVTALVFFTMYAALFMLRPHYAEPVYQELDGSNPALINALVLDSGRVAPDGHRYSLNYYPEECRQGKGTDTCFAAHGYRNFVEYQPADRFWRFQWTEAGILFAVTAVLGGVTMAGTVRRR